MKLKKLLDLIEETGGYVQKTKKGHFLVFNKHGLQIETFAERHGKGVKKGEVLDVYVNKVKKALRLE